MSAEEYITELLDERDTLDPVRYAHAIRMINDEIRRVESAQGKGPPPARDYPPVDTRDVREEVYREEVVKLSEKVVLPIAEFPKFNFVGRLLGPGGSIMKGIAETTRTKVSILGKGSMKDKAKEEELSKSEDPKHAHLKEPLHVFIQVDAPKSEGHARIADALECVKQALLPTPEDQLYNPMGDVYPQEGFRDRGAPRGSPPPRGGGSRGRGRGRRPEGNPPRPSRDEYAPRFDDSGPSRYHPEPRDSFRAGDKRGGAPSNNYTPKKFRDDPYADPYAKVDPYAETSRY